VQRSLAFTAAALALLMLLLLLICSGCAGMRYHYSVTMTAQQGEVLVTDQYGVSSSKPLTTQDVLASFRHGLNRSITAPAPKRDLGKDHAQVAKEGG